MKLYFYLILFLITPIFQFSQNISDAISLSIENENGNARYMSMGGAFGLWVEIFPLFLKICVRSSF